MPISSQISCNADSDLHTQSNLQLDYGYNLHQWYNVILYGGTNLIFSGLDWMSSICMAISRSFARFSWGKSSLATASTWEFDASCIAMSAARVWKTSPLATKSVSQFTSTRTPNLHFASTIEKSFRGMDASSEHRQHCLDGAAHWNCLGVHRLDFAETCLPPWMYEATTPSEAIRPAFLSAEARPFLRR